VDACITATQEKKANAAARAACISASVAGLPRDHHVMLTGSPINIASLFRSHPSS
jgi:hypothetical protein